MTPAQKQARLDAETKRYEHEPMLSADERARFIAQEAARLGITAPLNGGTMQHAGASAPVDWCPTPREGFQGSCGSGEVGDASIRKGEDVVKLREPAINSGRCALTGFKLPAAVGSSPTNLITEAHGVSREQGREK